MSPADFRFPKAVRLRRRGEFLRVQAEGRKLYTRHFLLLVAGASEGRPALPPARLGVTVSRKVGPAVRRNRIKRLVREVFRLDGKALGRLGDLVVIAKRDGDDLDLGTVRAELGSCWRRFPGRAQ